MRYILLVFIILTSCSPKVVNSLSEKKDTLIIRTIVRDTSIVVERDSSLLRALIECDSIGNARLAELIEYQDGEHIRVPAVRLQNNKLIVKAEVDSFSVAMSYLETHTELREKEILIQTEIVEVNKLNFLQRVLIYIGTLSIICIMIYLFFKLKF